MNDLTDTECDSESNSKEVKKVWKSKYQCLVGVVAGIGPEASVLLYQYVIHGQKYDKDSDHIPLLIFNNPEIPNNNLSLCGKGPSSVPALIHTATQLKKAGATHICIACNTAHAYAKEVGENVSIPVLHMVNLTSKMIVHKLSSRAPKMRRVGVMGTHGTLRAKIYHKAIAEASKVGESVQVLVPNSRNQDVVQECINRIKGGDANSNEVFELLTSVAQDLVDQGAQIIITGCTEIPLSFSSATAKGFDVEIIDPMKVLADEIISITTRSQRRN